MAKIIKAKYGVVYDIESLSLKGNASSNNNKGVNL